MPRFQIYKANCSEYRYFVVDTEDSNYLVARAESIGEAKEIVQDIEQVVYHAQNLEEKKDMLHNYFTEMNLY